MSKSVTRNSNSLAWIVVVVAGLVVLAIVAGLDLHQRLDAGQRVLDGARPIFTEERVVGERVGIGMISSVTDMLDPIVDAEGGAADEVVPLVQLVAGATGLSDAEVLAALETNFPHTYHLLLALPLDGVSAEIPALLDFVAANSELADGGEVLDAIAATTPNLAQAITNLIVVTDGFRLIPGIEPLTRFDGSPVLSVPDISDFFGQDVVPAVRDVTDDYRTLDTTAPPVDVFPALLLTIGILVSIYAVAMLIIVSAAVPSRKKSDDGGDESSGDDDVAEPAELVGAGST
ncbi:MAG: hypothetical protein IH940_07835 [Acidobacteria bacterium]|nr:hypothetical protein [Acidobacteriota bacterium]